MSDVYELAVSVDLRDELSETESAELRWHLGIGPQPERLSVVTEFPIVVEDEAGEPVIENEPRPLLAGSGAARRIGGVLGSALAGRADLPWKGWSLTSRQEIHPDDFDRVGELLCWLAERVHDTHRHGDDVVSIGHLRFHESLTPEVIEVANGRITWPA
ncbi:hypothetical protein OG887_38365 [Streptomyces sp. NBC_00053]|uniref:hypothetical protein n=1 Tax=unclassified Streptomyces TaxID=2593676 RepID=UPI000F5BB697|nr:MULTISPECIES: hypothetical protein [unclassified Streptomyces]WSG55262.1 hypothetical protein OHA38_38590 [Streptomyces sp. NBC_01732]WSX05977.1 hypothetical protein OG355_39050 [Streptomyces sp. NBC_00987]MCX4391749.1 hypothetical protein [Streptomyces sp. NBC_01767]MCX5103390.1 hypothetical protein [Streptomyces sp. NBC_00439]MCX5165080.1 hypothetical protein [Streptomyces sp. NBC_00305]